MIKHQFFHIAMHCRRAMLPIVVKVLALAAARPGRQTIALFVMKHHNFMEHGLLFATCAAVESYQQDLFHPRESTCMRRSISCCAIGR